MKTFAYLARLDWGPPISLAYTGPIVDLAMAEARRRCLKPDGLKWVSMVTSETVYLKEPPDGP